MHRYQRVKKKKTKRNIFIAFIIIVTTILIVSLVRLYSRIDISKSNEEIKVERRGTSSTNINENDESIENIIAETNYSVVGISKIEDVGDSVFSENAIEKLGLGTGIIVSSKGYIVTNMHVSGDKYSNCYVTLENGNSYKANVVWADSTLDLSILKINIEGMRSAKLGDSSKVKTGQTVYAIGNPIGYEFQRTVTFGIISAESRTLKFKENNTDILMTDLIQTDADINPGNSGGPLINTKGEVIGINSLKIDSAEGIGFAVPINIIKPIIEKFDKTGKFEEPTIGISGYDKNVIPYLDKDISITSGVYVENIVKGSPAEQKGILKGDIILKIDDKEINTMNELKEYVYSKYPGDEVNLSIKRNGISKNVKINLGKK